MRVHLIFVAQKSMYYMPAYWREMAPDPMLPTLACAEKVFHMETVQFDQAATGFPKYVINQTIILKILQTENKVYEHLTFSA